MNNVFVGEDIILPRSLRSQNAFPYAIQTKTYTSPSAYNFVSSLLRKHRRPPLLKERLTLDLVTNTSSVSTSAKCSVEPPSPTGEG